MPLSRKAPPSRNKLKTARRAAARAAGLTGKFIKLKKAATTKLPGSSRINALPTITAVA